MESLIIQADENTPSINFNPKTGRLVMEGLAVPENVHELFNPKRIGLSITQNSLDRLQN